MSSCSFGCRARLVPGSIAVKVSQCTPPDIFTDCFTGLAGVIPPGVIGGWSYSSFLGPSAGGTASFNGDEVFLTAAPGLNAEISKALLAPYTMFGSSGQFRFTEFSALPGGGSVYQVVVRDFSIAAAATVVLDDTGFVAVGVADGVTPAFFGAWVPNNGTHVVHWTIDGAGIPTLAIDGVPVVLAPFAPLGVPLSPINTMFLVPFNAGGAPDTCSFDYDIVTTGIFPPTTVFCCPDGSPAS